MRLSIDVTAEQHQKIKAVSALSGQSIKEYVLERVLPNDKGLQALEVFLEPRIVAAERGVVSDKSVEQIFKEIYQEMQ
ncbi:MAG: antitoxin [Methylococcales bacterium]|nr:antitoxin [Methylococcales bacterium]